MTRDRKGWLERPGTGRVLWIVFAAVLAATVIAEFLVDMHDLFGVDGSFGFNAWFGFGSCLLLVLLAKLLAGLLKRRDTYYGDEG